jgi:hypothetical protein
LNEVAKLVILTFEVLGLAVQALWTVLKGVEEEAFTLLQEITVWVIATKRLLSFTSLLEHLNNEINNI